MRGHPSTYWARLLALPAVLALAAMPAGAWRSELFPETWSPGYEDGAGRFLHDFSYAGYHNGEAPLPDLAGAPVFDVLDYGADNTGVLDTTPAIQDALDAAAVAGGGVVFLPAGAYRCEGLLDISASYTVLRGAGSGSTFVYFTRFADMQGKSHITFRGGVARGPDVPLAADSANRSRVVHVADASGLAPGDEVSLGWVITDEFVAEHGMTGTWTVFNGTWRPFFRRTITGIAGNAVTLDVPLRYPAKVRDGASLRKESGYLRECGLEHLSLANAVDYHDAWSVARAHLVTFQDAKDCWMRNVRSFPSPLPEADGYHLQNNGLRVWASKRVTVAECQFEKAQNRGGGGCGYLFEVGASSEVLFRECIGRDGRHNFIQNWDFGASGLVFLRCYSTGGRTLISPDLPIGGTGYSEYHHSLAMACLVDACVLDDGWYGGNRRGESSGAGHTVTQNVYWNTSGAGEIRSFAYGWGYIIGTHGVSHVISTFLGNDEGTEPVDYVEGAGLGASLEPASLYEAQLIRRIGALPGFTSACPRPAGGLYAVGDDLCLMPPAPVAPSSAFVWRKNGVLLVDDGRISGSSGRRLSIADLRVEDSGLYTCEYEDGAKTPQVFTAEVNVAPLVPVRPWLAIVAILTMAGLRLRGRARKHSRSFAPIRGSKSTR